ncbi:MAG: VCBS repeat-containing protein [Xanthobacteraceae bacterium]|nr:VCBS repeat-containing protein [Xanthobacteraceae bacterium]
MLAAYFALTANPSNTANGTNYATSGAKNQTANSSQTGGFTAAVPTVTQIANYLTAVGNVADPNALYFVYSGDNDTSYALGHTGSGPFPADPNAYMSTAAQQLSTAVGQLATAGAKHIIVSGLEYGYAPNNDATWKALKQFYTTTLFSDLTTANVPYVQGNPNAVRLAITANPSSYGFTSITTATVACSQPAGVPTAWALLCSSNASAPSTWTAPTQLTRLFADDQHLATAGQRLMARHFRNLVVPWAGVHDVNGDGKSDIVWRDQAGDLAIWEMNGAAVIANAALGNPGGTWSIVAIRDFNSDSKFDLLWRDTAGNTAIWFMNGMTVASTASLGNIPPGWNVAGTGDFNSDGYGDILWEDGSGNLAVWLLGSNGQVIANAGLGNLPPSAWSVVGIADFNGDGKSDILWRDTAGDTYIWFMNGTAVTSSAGLGNIPPAWSVAGTGDFNNDSFSDILWQDTSGNLAVWLMNGATVFSSGGLGQLSRSTWTLATVGDFNGDGNSDLLWRDTSGNTVVWYMNGTAVSSPAVIGNIPPTWLVQSASAD